MLSLSWKIHGYIKMYEHPTTTHTSYVCNALGLYNMEYPRCHFHFLCTLTVFKLFVYICKENTCICDTVIGQFCSPYSTAQPVKSESSLSCAPD